MIEPPGGDRQVSFDLIRSLVENSQDVLYRMSLPDGRYEYVSPAATGIFGYTPEEFYERPRLIAEIIHPDWEDFFVKEWERLLEGQVPPTYEYQVTTPDGETRWIHQRNSGVWNEDGSLIAIEGVVTDSTRRKAADGALIRERDQNSWYLDMAGTLLVGLDRAGRIEMLNRKGCQILGYEREEILGRNWFELCLPEEQVAEVQKVFDQLMEGELEPVEFYENRIRTRTGEERLIAWHNAHRRDENGEIIGTLSSGEDLTDRKVAEDRLRASEEKYQDLYENAPDMYVSVSPENGEIIECNQTLLRTLGFERQEILGRPVFDLYAPEAHEAARHAFRIFLETGRVREAELVVKRKDGSRLDVSLNVEAVRGEDGQILHSRSSWRDITETKAARGELRQVNRTLNERVKELGCMYMVAKAVGEEPDLASLFRNVVELVPRGFQFPDLTRCQIQFDGTDYSTPGFEEGKPTLDTELTVGGEVRGTLKICYVDEEPEADEGPFLAEECQLAKGIGRALSSAVERREAEEKAARKDARFRHTFHSQMIPMFFWNMDGDITEANEAFLEMVGYTRAELLSGEVSWAAMTPPEYADLDVKGIEQIRTTGVCRPFEKEYIRKDGSRVPILIGAAISEWSDRDGICFVVDITDRKETEKALAESEERFRLMVSEVEDYAIFLMDPEGRINSWNEGAEKIKGYKAEEIIGEHFSRFYPQRDIKSGIPDEKLRIAEERGRVEQEGWRLRKDGSRFMASVVITAVRDSEGELVGFSKVTRDITERKAAEEKLARHADQQEALVSERTEELQAINRELEAFTYSVSHDLRAPLRAINGFSEILEDEKSHQLDEEGTRYLATIRSNTVLMATLIEDLLELSRVGRVELETGPVPMAGLVKGVLEDLEAAFPDPTRILTVGELPGAVGDLSLLKQVWSNLLSNAFKFSAEAGPSRVEISGWEEGTETIYAVQDNGAGFDMRYESRLFSPFERLHSSEEFEGTGVGLAIAKRAITRLGGRIWGEGEVGQGARFCFCLPNGR